MVIPRNLSNARRVMYVAMGLAMAAAPFLWTLPGWSGVVLPAVGVVVILEGALGF